MSSIEVIAPGPLALLQDSGRPGYAAVGVGLSGAVDRGAYELGARMVAHSEGLAAIEITFGGFAATVKGAAIVAFTGADAEISVNGHRRPHNAVLQLDDGDVIRVGQPARGLRTYFTVRGGFDVPAVLGSRSTDTLAGLGPAQVRAGDVLPIGEFEGKFPNVDAVASAVPATGTVELTLLPGPRTEWFSDQSGISGKTWSVSSRSNRVGVRLEGDSLTRDPAYQDQELPSEAMVRGCVQVPPSGQPIIFLNDHPVTGGYPVIGVLTEADVDRAAQLQPGQAVRFR
ncbi:biotin-dependent carboxyltransferase family protein [Ornithinimicrobium sp. Arc0846-15]|nr:biotin-dependent carboxyltransferase family protein [Ornithinimicrobium laminariae]